MHQSEEESEVIIGFNNQRNELVISYICPLYAMCMAAQTFYRN